MKNQNNSGWNRSPEIVQSNPLSSQDPLNWYTLFFISDELRISGKFTPLFEDPVPDLLRHRNKAYQPIITVSTFLSFLKMQVMLPFFHSSEISSDSHSFTNMMESSSAARFFRTLECMSSDPIDLFVLYSFRLHFCFLKFIFNQKGHCKYCLPYPAGQICNIYL